ncbi:MAG: BsuPI-related putative proteinase inhibitor [Gemmatimonadota bacterium]
MLAVAVVLAGCSGGDPARPDDGAAVVTDDGVRYTAATAVMESFPVQLRTTLTLENVGTEVVRLTFPDGCVVLLAAARPGSDEAVWEEERACTMALEEVSLAPGEEREFTSSTVSARDILGASLPDGPYDLLAVLRPHTGTVRVPAGRVALAVPRGD